jgi:hypothetical protein
MGGGKGKGERGRGKGISLKELSDFRERKSMINLGHVEAK